MSKLKLNRSHKRIMALFIAIILCISFTNSLSMKAMAASTVKSSADLIESNPADYRDSENLALNKSVFASSELNATYVKSNITDGVIQNGTVTPNNSNRWVPQNYTASNTQEDKWEWVVVDLGSVMPVNQVDVFFYEVAASYNVYLWDSAETLNEDDFAAVYNSDDKFNDAGFTLISEYDVPVPEDALQQKTDQIVIGDALEVSSVNARYIIYEQLKVIDTAMQYGSSIREIAVYGDDDSEGSDDEITVVPKTDASELVTQTGTTDYMPEGNLAHGKDVFTSSALNASFTAGNITDGTVQYGTVTPNNTNRWVPQNYTASNTEEDKWEWVVVDLGSVMPVDQVDIFFYEVAASYNVYLWDNAQALNENDFKSAYNSDDKFSGAGFTLISTYDTTVPANAPQQKIDRINIEDALEASQTNARYIIYEQHKVIDAAMQYGSSIREIAVYGDDSTDDDDEIIIVPKTDASELLSQSGTSDYTQEGNLANGKNVLTSSALNATFAAGNITDGTMQYGTVSPNNTNRWVPQDYTTSNTEENQWEWVVVDLGSVMSVDQVDIFFYEVAASYNIYLWDNAESFDEDDFKTAYNSSDRFNDAGFTLISVYDTSVPTNAPQQKIDRIIVEDALGTASANARYIIYEQLKVINSGKRYGGSIREIAVYDGTGGNDEITIVPKTDASELLTQTGTSDYTPEGNLAHGKNVLTSSALNATFGAGNITDGTMQYGTVSPNNTNRWVPKDYTTSNTEEDKWEWAVVDLGSVMPVDQADIFFYEVAASYNIYLWDNPDALSEDAFKSAYNSDDRFSGAGFTLISAYDTSVPTNAPQQKIDRIMIEDVLGASPVNARYIIYEQLKVINTGKRYGGSIREIAVYGDDDSGNTDDTINLALGKTATASSQYSATYGAQKVVDGIYSDAANRWGCADSDAAPWIQIDFGAETAFNKVVLYEWFHESVYSYRAEEFEIYYDQGDGSWVHAYTGGTIGEKGEFILREPVMAKRVRINFTKSLVDAWPAIQEIEIYLSPTDFSKLEETITNAVTDYGEEQTNVGYIADSWNNYLSELAAARQVLSLQSPSLSPYDSPKQGDVDDAINALIQAIESLEETFALNLSADTVPIGELRRIKQKSGTAVDTLTSSDPSVAEIINNGFIVAKEAGTVIITGTRGGETATCTVTVVPVNDDDFDRLRKKYRGYVVPWELDMSDPLVQDTVDATIDRAKELHESMRKTFVHGDMDSMPWDGGLIFNGRRATGSPWLMFQDLNTMTKAFYYPGELQYDPQLYDDIVSALDWFLHNMFRGAAGDVISSGNLGSRVLSRADFQAIGDEESKTAGCVIVNSWYSLDIGIPRYAGDTLILLAETGLPQDLFDAYVKRINVYSLDTNLRGSANASNSGAANLVDVTRNVMIHGILAKDEARLRQAASQILMNSTVPLAGNGDGYYWDGSVIEHNYYPYELGYGQNALLGIADVTKIIGGESIHGSPIAFNTMYQDRLAEYLDKSYLPAVWKGALMPGLQGREISSESSSIVRAIDITQRLYTLLPILPADKQNDMKSAIKSWLSHTPELLESGDITMNVKLGQLLSDSSVTADEWTGLFARNNESRVFWRPGDFTFSVSTNNRSANVRPYESINAMNMRGIHTGDGMSYLFLEDDYEQFRGDYFATVPYNHMPGTTLEIRSDGVYGDLAPLYANGNDGANTGVNNSHTWAGTSVLTDDDGQYGATGFLMNLGTAFNASSGPFTGVHTSTTRNMDMNVTANKSWFMLGDKIIALGSNITSTKGRPVDTTIESRKLPANETASFSFNGADAGSFGQKVASGNSYAHLGYGSAQIGYYLPMNGKNLSVGTQDHSGAWLYMNKDESSEIKTDSYAEIYLHHGANPSGDTYEYVMLPNKTQNETAAFASNPDYQVIANTNTLHAVYDKTLKILAVNNFANAPAAVTSPGTGMIYEVDKAASVVIREYANGEISVGILDPTTGSNSITVNVKNQTGSKISGDSNVVVSAVGEDIAVSVTNPTYDGKKYNTWQARLAISAIDGDDPYYLQYHPNGGTGSAPATTYYGTGTNVTVADAPADMIRDGYTFAGWNKQADGKGETLNAGDDFIMPAGNVDLYAMWNEVTQTVDDYNVTYAPGGEGVSGMPGNLTGKHIGDSIVVPTTVPIRTGYTFKEWVYSDGTTTKAIPVGGGFEMPAANVTLTAAWTIVSIPPAVNNVTVTFHYNHSGLGAVKTVTIPSGTGVGAANMPYVSRSGYDFKGWDTQADGNGSNFYATTIVTSNMNIYAQWDIRSSSNNGGDRPSDINSDDRPNGNNNKWDSGSNSSNNDRTNTYSNNTASAQTPVTTAQATSAANAAVAVAHSSGSNTAVVNIKNVRDITLTSLQAMSKAAGDTPLKLQSDSMIGAAVDVRVTVNPSLATAGLNLNGSTQSTSALSVTSLFERFFTNNVMTIVLGQKGNFGQPAEIAVRTKAGFKTQNLMFYVYDQTANTYTQIAAPAHWVDTNGYIHFTTRLAGIIIISDGPLVRE